MKPDGPLKLVGGVLDLPILDCDGNYCGIVDDVALDPDGGVVGLLVGPGAWAGRLPRWAFRAARAIAGAHMVRLAWDEIAKIDSVMTLKRTGQAVGLTRAEDRARRLIPRRGAL